MEQQETVEQTHIIVTNVETTTNVNNNSTVSGKHYIDRGVEVEKTVGKSRTGVFGLEVDAKRGETVFYKIKVKNTSTEYIDIKLEDFIPEELNDKDGTTADSDRFMT
jgi:uncharacterized repeat protein (TIGR01451 family)